MSNQGSVMISVESLKALLLELENLRRERNYFIREISDLKKLISNLEKKCNDQVLKKKKLNNHNADLKLCCKSFIKCKINANQTNNLLFLNTEKPSQTEEFNNILKDFMEQTSTNMDSEIRSRDSKIEQLSNQVTDLKSCFHSFVERANPFEKFSLSFLDSKSPQRCKSFSCLLKRFENMFVFSKDNSYETFEYEIHDSDSISPYNK